MKTIVHIKKAPPVIDEGVRFLCLRPYPNHPKGCPNFNKKDTCPPKIKLWQEICDTRLATWIYYTRFDLKSHVERMKSKHPDWSDRQLNCCLYWQNSARKPLKEYIKENRIPGQLITMCPEAMGINVTATMKNIGIILEWPPVNWTYQVAMAGWKL